MCNVWGRKRVSQEDRAGGRLYCLDPLGGRNWLTFILVPQPLGDQGLWVSDTSTAVSTTTEWHFPVVPRLLCWTLLPAFSLSLCFHSFLLTLSLWFTFKLCKKRIRLVITVVRIKLAPKLRAWIFKLIKTSYAVTCLSVPQKPVENRTIRLVQK